MFFSPPIRDRGRPGSVAWRPNCNSKYRDHARQDNVWHGFAVTTADIVSGHCKRIEGDQEVMRIARFDPKARGIGCAVKRDNVIGAKDQRTTSGPTGDMTRIDRNDRTHDQTQYRKKNP